MCIDIYIASAWKLFISTFYDLTLLSYNPVGWKTITD